MILFVCTSCLQNYLKTKWGVLKFFDLLKSFCSNLGVYHFSGFGNVLPHGEFNFTFDPIAAHVVLKDLECPITLVCWELCLDNLVSWVSAKRLIEIEQGYGPRHHMPS